MQQQLNGQHEVSEELKALAFANNLHATSGAAALSYATVYPLVMFLRIITPQLLAVLFWGLS